MTEDYDLPENPETALTKVPSQLVPFVPGDPRINRKGHPKTTDVVRKLAQAIAYEEVSEQEGYNRIELILRDWASSKTFEKQLAFIQYAFGKVPDLPASEARDVKIVVNWGKVITRTEIPIDS
jgi:hypothetical protein